MLSIDPGKTGAVVWWQDIYPDHVHQFSVPKGQRFFGTDEIEKMDSIIALDAACPTVVMEKLDDRRNFGQSTVHNNTTAVNWGIWYSLVVYWSGADNVVVVPASTWKKHFGLKGGRDNKYQSLDLARELWPQFADKELKYKKNHDLAEALLIGQWYLDKG